jgi:hypothetical protein
MRPTTNREELLAELAKERYLPVLPPPATTAQPKARQTRAKAPPKTKHPTRRPTGTGWPES